MTYKIRRSRERKYFDHGWLKTYHTFSFGSYYDPQFMGFRDLRVINEDRVAAGRGFPSHDHQDMEIISIVLEGALAHKDSTGGESVLPENGVQAMSAGTGVTHSEYNPSATELAHFLQIWILPEKRGLTPRYQESKLPTAHNEWSLIASKAGKQNSLKIEQDVSLYFLALDKGKEVEKKLLAHRYGWLQMIDGEVSLNGEKVEAGDGVALEPESVITLKAISSSRILYFDLR
jgi:quercetin 2,3-dioxygenase